MPDLDVAGTGPKAGADHFVGICFTRDGIGAGTFWSAASGEARDREVEAAPIKMNRTALADEASAKFFEDGIYCDQDAPECVRGFGIVGFVRGVFGERNWICYFVGVAWIFTSMASKSSDSVSS